MILISQCMTCFGSLPSSIHKMCPNHFSFLLMMINSSFCSDDCDIFSSCIAKYNTQKWIFSAKITDMLFTVGEGVKSKVSPLYAELSQSLANLHHASSSADPEAIPNPGAERLSC